MDVARQKRDWDDLAGVDSLSAIIPPPQERSHWTPEEFFGTGEEELQRVLQAASGLERPRRWERSLDFGCGVGRISRPAAGHFQESYGVDISSEMIEQARTLNADVPNCTFFTNVAPDLRAFEDNFFDFVYSSRVLQHLPGRPAILAYVAEFLRVVRPDGLVVFQLPHLLRWRNRLQPRRRAYGLLRAAGVDAGRLHRAAKLHPMRMSAVPERDVRAVIQEAGGVVARVELAEPGMPLGGLLYFAHPA